MDPHPLLGAEMLESDGTTVTICKGATLALDERFHLHHIAPAADWVAPRLPTWLQRQIA